MCQTDAASYIEVDRKNGMPVRSKVQKASLHIHAMSFWKRRGTTPPVLADSGAYPCQVNRLSQDPCIFPCPLFGRQVKIPCHVTVTAMLFLLFCFSLNADSDGTAVSWNPC